MQTNVVTVDLAVHTLGPLAKVKVRGKVMFSTLTSMYVSASTCAVLERPIRPILDNDEVLDISVLGAQPYTVNINECVFAMGIMIAHIRSEMRA